MYLIFSQSMSLSSPFGFHCSLYSTEVLSRQSVTVDKDVPLEVDIGFLTATDLNPVDEESYKYVSV